MAAVERLGPAIGQVKAATARLAATSPTDTLAVGRVMAGLGAVLTQFDRLLAAAGGAARADGLEVCGGVLRVDRTRVRAPVPGRPSRVTVEPPAVLSGRERTAFLTGRSVAAQSGCVACHRIGTAGNYGPGPDLTQIGSRVPALALARELRDPVAPMPSYRGLPAARFGALVAFLSDLRG